MGNIDIEKIWKASNDSESGGIGYSLEDIRRYRTKKSGEASRSGRWSISFDIIYKAIVISLYVFLIVILNGQQGYRYLSGFIALLLTLLVIMDFRFLRQLNLIKETDSVIENLTKKLEFLKSVKNYFIFISSLSNLFFVLACFFLYYHYKYNEIRLSSPFDDPVIYLFLLAAFLISYISQQTVCNRQIKELRESIEDIDDIYTARAVIDESRKLRMINICIYLVLVLTGIFLLVFFYFYFNV